MEPFKTQYRVYYEDTDAGGVVYYANYLKFAERARTDALRARGIVQSELREKTGLVFVVHHLTADYHGAAKLDDMLDVTVEAVEIGGASLKMHQEISAGGKRLFSLDIRIVCVDAQMKPARIPDELKKKF